MSSDLAIGGNCPTCGTPIDDMEGEPTDTAVIHGIQHVITSIRYTLKPCGHSFKVATGAST